MDTSFENRGTGSLSSEPSVIVVLNDGKILVAGDFYSYNGVRRSKIARLNSDGSLDETFTQTGTGISSSVGAMAVQDDGKILVGGGFTSYNGVITPRLARLNSDGSLDETFTQTGVGLDNYVRSIVLQDDGKILVGGSFTSYNGASVSRVARLNSDGSLDGTFTQTGTGLSGEVTTMAVQDNGRILLAGSFTTYNGVSRPRVARLNSDGSLDSSFVQTGTGLNNAVAKLVLSGDGKVYVGGSFTSYNGTSKARFLRLNSDGSLDSSFTQTGTGFSSSVNTIALQDDGKIYVGGSFPSYNGVSVSYLARLNSDGSRDGSFTQTGTGLSSYVNTMALQPDGKLMVGGNFEMYNGLFRLYLTRLNSDGSECSDWNLEQTGFNITPDAVAIQSDGKILVGGMMTSYNRIPVRRLARLNSDGTLDDTFVQTGTGLSYNVNDIYILDSGKILVAGGFTTYNGVSALRFARLNSNGTLDTSFALTGTGFNNDTNAIVLQSDGKIFVAGSFTTYNDISRQRLARLNSDGTLDMSFALAGTGFSGPIYKVVLQPDGKILATGSFASYNSVSRPRIARLNSDGTLDTSFALTGTGFNGTVNNLALQDDGKILVGGNFSSYDTTPVNRLVRLNSDGSLDSSFNQVDAGFSIDIHQIILQDDGKILVGGTTTSYYGLLRRFNSDGNIDESFAIEGTGFSGRPSGIALQSDGKVVVIGFFKSFNNLPISYITRLDVSDLVPPTGGIVINSGSPTTSTTSVNLNLSANDDSSGVSEMMVSNTATFTGGTWEPYSVLKEWVLSSGDGIKTVYVKYKDGFGNVSSIYSDTITYELPVVVLTNPAPVVTAIPVSKVTLLTEIIEPEEELQEEFAEEDIEIEEERILIGGVLVQPSSLIKQVEEIPFEDKNIVPVTFDDGISLIAMVEGDSENKAAEIIMKGSSLEVSHVKKLDFVVPVSSFEQGDKEVAGVFLVMDEKSVGMILDGGAQTYSGSVDLGSVKSTSNFVLKIVANYNDGSNLVKGMNVNVLVDSVEPVESSLSFENYIFWGLGLFLVGVIIFYIAKRKTQLS